MGVQSVATVGRIAEVARVGGYTAADVNDAASPVGSGIVYSLPSDGYIASGVTGPEIGSSGGSLVSFDKSTTERLDIRADRQPSTWRTVDVYITMFNTNGTAGDVYWRLVWNTATTVNTTASYAASGSAQVKQIGTGLSLFGIDVTSSLTLYGAHVALSRIGGDAADTLDGDAALGSLILVRAS